MAAPGFFNDNENRTYPFIVDRQGLLPDCGIVDFGSTMLAGSGYVEGQHEVWLEWVRKLGGTIEFSFRSDAPGLLGQSLIFQRDINDPDYVTEFSWAQTALTEAQLDEACECDVNQVCNATFDYSVATTTTSTSTSSTTSTSTTSSTTAAPDPCDKYPGSAVYGWDVTSSVTQAADLLRMDIDSLGTESAKQEMTEFSPGQTLKCFFDLVTITGPPGSFVSVSVNGPDEDTVIAQTVATEPGTFGFSLEVPTGITSLWVVVRAFNASSSAAKVAEFDNVTLQNCTSNSSSFPGEPPEPDVCPSDPVWEGFLVTGDLECLAEVLDDCTKSGGTAGGLGEVDVLFLTDTTGSMGSYITTIKSIFSPLATSVAELLPEVDFRWAAASYRDYEDGGNYLDGIQVDQTFTATIATVQTAIDGWSAAGGGDSEEQNLSALKIAADEWLTTFSGRSGSQKMVIWGGDVGGWEDGAKGNPYPSLPDTIQALVDAGVRVVGINSEAAGSGLDDEVVSPHGRQASQITSATGGILQNSVSLSDADEIAQIVAEQILVTSSTPGTVTVSLFEGPSYVEPSRTKNLDGSYVRSMAAVNTDRTRTTTPTGCRDYCWPYDPGDHYVACECLAQDVRFEEGYNSSIRVDARDNAIVFDGEAGAGAGPACTEVFLHPLERPPRGRDLLTGGPSCGDVVRSINGSGRQFFEILGKQGVTVTPIPDEHRIIIDVNLNNMALCPDLEPGDPVDCCPPSVNPCDCGPEDPFSCPSSTDESCPTTTTTTPDPACGTGCEHRWEVPVGGGDGSWTQVSGSCDTGCDCYSPARDGTYNGEVLWTGCETTECGVLNSEFERVTKDEDDVVLTLPDWLITTLPDYGYLFWSEDGFTNMPIRHQGPVLRFYAVSGLEGPGISQITPVDEWCYYDLKVYIAEYRGETGWGLKNGAGAALSWISEIREPGVEGDEGEWVTRRYRIPAGLTAVAVYFQVTNRLTFSGRGWMDVASVCLTPVGCDTTTTSTTTAAPSTTTSTTSSSTSSTTSSTTSTTSSTTTSTTVTSTTTGIPTSTTTSTLTTVTSGI